MNLSNNSKAIDILKLIYHYTNPVRNPPEHYIGRLKKKTNIANSHFHRLVKELEKAQLIQKHDSKGQPLRPGTSPAEYNGKRYLKLTSKGAEALHAVNHLNTILKQLGINIQEGPPTA